MKKTLCFVSVFALCLGASAAGGAPSGGSGHLLHVIIQDNVLPVPRDSWTQEDNRFERYVIMHEVVQDALKNAGFDGELNFMRFGANMPREGDQLHLIIQRWEQAPYSLGRAIAVEFQMAARLRINGEEVDLGRFTGRDSHIVIGTPESLDEFGPAARKAVEQAVDFYQDTIRIIGQHES